MAQAPFPDASPLTVAECRAGVRLCPFCKTGGYPAARGFEPTTSRSRSGHSTPPLFSLYTGQGPVKPAGQPATVAGVTVACECSVDSTPGKEGRQEEKKKFMRHK